MASLYTAATAAISWIDKSGALHVRIYASDGQTVTERRNDTGSSGWTSGTFSQPGLTVSATVWQDAKGPNIRVYCTSQGTTTEWCQNYGGDWFQGSYTPA